MYCRGRALSRSVSQRAWHSRRSGRGQSPAPTFFIFPLDKRPASVYSVLNEPVHTAQTIQGGDPIDILISNSSGKPIYEQICGQIKTQIMDGTLTAGDCAADARAERLG